MVAIVIGIASCYTRYITKGVKLFYPLPLNVVSPLHFKTGGLVDLSLATAFSFGTVYTLFQPFFNEFMLQWLN